MKHLTESFKVSYITYSSKNVELERLLKLAIVISVQFNSNSLWLFTNNVFCETVH